MSTRSPYPTDLCDDEWEILEPLVPTAKPGGRPRAHQTREILNAIFYVLRGGCAWRLLPHDFSLPWQTAYHYFRAWRLETGPGSRYTPLFGSGWAACWVECLPFQAAISTQMAKTTEKGGTRGYDGGKKISGRKRHLLVDTEGLVIGVRVHESEHRRSRWSQAVVGEAQ